MRILSWLTDWLCKLKATPNLYCDMGISNVLSLTGFSKFVARVNPGDALVDSREPHHQLGSLDYESE